MVGVYVCARRRDELGRSFLAFVICGAFYQLGIYGTFVFRDARSVMLWTSVFVNGIHFLPPSFLWFVGSYVGRTRRVPVLVTLAISVGFCVCTVLGVFRPELVAGPIKYDVVLSWPYLVLIVYVTVSMGFGILLVGRRYLKATSAIDVARNRWFLAATTVCFVLGLANPLRGAGVHVYPLGSLNLLLYVLLLGYGIVRHGLFDLPPAVRRAFGHGVLSFVLVGGYAVALGVIAAALGVGVFERFWINAGVLILLSMIVLPLRDRIQRLVDRVFLGKRYDYRVTIEALSRDMARMLESRQLLTAVAAKVCETLNIGRAEAYVVTSDGASLALRLSHSMSEGSLYYDETESPRRIPVAEGKKWTEGSKRGRFSLSGSRSDTPPDHRTEVAVPVESRGRLIGVLAWGERPSQMPYTEDDMVLLRVVGNSAAVALENALLYDSVAEMKRYVENVFRSLADAVVTVDPQGRVVRANDAAVHAFGSIRGKPTREAFARSPVLLSLVSSSLSGEHNSGESVEYGDKVLHVRTSPLQSAGEPGGVVLVATDETRRRELENKLKRVQRFALLGRVASGVAHEIRNPISSIKVLVQLLEQKLDDPEYRRTLVSVVPAEIDRLDTMVRALLEYSRPPKLVRVSTELTELARLCAALFSEEAKQQGIAVEVGADGPLPPASVDGEKIKQVLLNLLRNSAEAIIESRRSNGKIVLRLLADGDGQVRISVSDNGCGIPPDRMDELFRPFSSTKEHGTGLGLAISQKIVEEHGGTIDVQTSVGQGATFTVTLPV